VDSRAPSHWPPFEMRVADASSLSAIDEHRVSSGAEVQVRSSIVQLRPVPPSEASESVAEGPDDDASMFARRRRRKPKREARTWEDHWLLNIVEKCCARRREAKLRREVEAQLWRIAFPDLAPAQRKGMEKPNLTPEQVMAAYRLLRRQDTLDVRVVQGVTSWKRFIMVRCCQTLLAAILVLLVYLGLALLVFAVPRDFHVQSSTGVLTDPSDPLRIVSTGSTVGLYPVWEYPHLSLDELRKVEDVVIVQNQATHVQHVAMISRTSQGTVSMTSSDGSTIRVEPDGRTWWQRSGHSDILLNAMGSWRAFRRDAEIAWLTDGVASTQVVIPT